MKYFVTLLLALFIGAVPVHAQDVLIKRDNGTSLGGYFNAAAFTNESVIIPVAGPCQVLEIHIYYLGNSASKDTLIIAGDASEGTVPPTHWVWGYNTIIDPIIVDYNGTPGWKTIDVRGMNLRSDGYDRIVVQHWLKKSGPFFSVDSDAQTTPYWSFLLNPAETNSLGGPGRYYLSTNDYMVRILVRYDFPGGQGSEQPPAPTLTNVAIPAGLLNAGQPIKSAIASVTDIDADGWDDISIGGNYFRNKGDGSFENVTSAVGIGAGYAMWGDFDNDGYPDAYVLNGGEGDRLFRNGKLIRFDDVTAASGLSNPAPTVTAVWLDYNVDGHLDLFLANGRRESSGTETYFQDKLWKNNGDGTFSDVTVQSGIAAAEPAPYLDTWGATACDYNNDGLTDIFVATYRLAADMLFRNNGDGTFTEVGAQTGARGVPTASPQYFGHGMGCDFGDFDNDGWSDLAVGNLGHPDWRGAVSNPSLIFHNNSGVNFTNLQREMGLKFFEMNSGITWADLDNDGYLDLWQSQYSYQAAGTSGEPSRYSRVYMNQGPPEFRLKDKTWNFGALIHGAWTVSRLDFDNDGDVDLLVASPHDGVALFRNDLPRNGQYLSIHLEGKPSAGVTQSAFGTRVVAYAGGKAITRTLSTSSAGSRAATNSTTLHFGLGASAAADSVVVHYPNGNKRTHTSLLANRRYSIPYDGEISVGVESLPVAAGWSIGYAALSSGMLDFTLNAASPLPASDVELYDLLGRRLFSLALPSPEPGRHALHLPLRPASGTYFLLLRNTKGLRTAKVHVIR